MIGRPTVDSIHVILLEHTKPVPVNGCAVILVQILHLHLDCVAPASFDKWTRVRPVNDLCKFCESIGTNIFLCDFEVILEMVSFHCSACTK